MLGQLAQAGFDQEDALSKGVVQRRARRVHDAASTVLPSQANHAGVEVIRDARGQASTGYHVSPRGDRVRQQVKAPAPLRLAELGAFQDEPVLAAGGGLVHREVLSRTAPDGHHVMG
ncbi:hypothetical protein GCM10027090_40990 [Sinomonas soli]